MDRYPLFNARNGREQKAGGWRSMDKGESCYTFDAAMELAITMEEASFRHYLEAIGIVKNKNAREILRGFALDELEHKQTIERALVEGRMGDEGQMKRPVTTMGLDYI